MKNLEFLKQKKYLILDDQPKIIEMIQTYLELDEIVNVDTTDNAKIALEKIKEAHDLSSPYDIVVVDCNMPIMSGKEFVNIVRENDDYKNLGLLIMTGDPEHNTVKEMLLAGANDYLSKPFNATVLLRKLEATIKSLHQIENKIDFLPVRISTFIKDEPVSFDLFHFEHDKHRLLLKKDDYIKDKHLDTLKKFNIKKLFIEDKDEPTYQTYLNSKIDKLISAKTISLDDKGELISDFGQGLIKQASINPNEENIKQLSKISNTLNNFLDKNGTKGLQSIFSVEKDLSVYRHSLNVSSIVLMIVQKIIELHSDKKSRNHKLAAPFDGVFNNTKGTSNFDLLMQAAMIHDIGRDTMEPDASKDHATIGVERLQEYDHIDPKVREIVLHHEEYCDGSGGPNKLNRTKLSNYTKIITIADYCETEVVSKELAQADFFILMKENRDKFMPQLVDIVKLILY